MAYQQVSLFLRTAVSNVLTRSITLAQSPKLIQMTPCFWAEPLKKKKRMDPAVVKAREERRKKKMEKQIRRLEKNQKQLKPIEEMEIPLEYNDHRERRIRPPVISAERMEEITLIKKQWSRYMLKRHMADVQMLDRMVHSQKKALEELRTESFELYQAAVRVDEQLLPFTFNGPTDTPEIENYNSPDGDYVDISKKWQ